jgi:hypothetical protein
MGRKAMGAAGCTAALGAVLGAGPAWAAAPEAGPEAASPAAGAPTAGPEAAPAVDLATAAALGVTVFWGSALVHEGLGHGGACLATGGRVEGVSLANVGCVGSRAPAFEKLAGPLANVAVGGASAGWLLARPPRDPVAYSYLWLQSAVHLFQASGYLMVGPWVPVGDMGTGGVLAGVSRPLPAQVALSAAGAGMTFGTVLLSNHLGAPIWGRGAELDRKSRRRMTVLPYTLGGGLITASSIANRAGPEFAASAGVANLAGTLFLAYMPLFFADEVFIPGPAVDGPPRSVRAEKAWLIAGGVVATAAIATFGPGVGPGYPEPHPLDVRAW